MVLLVGLVVESATTLSLLWNLVIPLVPASLLVAPQLWRNVCPLATLNMVSKPFSAISAGPLVRFNPSVSFHVKGRSREEVEALWDTLAAGGAVLMPLGEYPSSGQCVTPSAWTPSRSVAKRSDSPRPAGASRCAWPVAKPSKATSSSGPTARGRSSGACCIRPRAHPGRAAWSPCEERCTLNGFVVGYLGELRMAGRAHPTDQEINEPMSTFTPDQVPVISQLAQQFCVCDQWYSEVPGRAAGSIPASRSHEQAADRSAEGPLADPVASGRA
jgi:hypothetical protein